MKHIKKYNKYQIKNEGVKDLVAGGLMALSTMGTGVSSGQSADKIEKNIKAEKEEELISDLKVFPNPVWVNEGNILYVKFNLLEKSELNIKIYNSKGNVVLEKNLGIKNKGDNTIKIGIDDLYKLETGLYFISLQNNNQVYTKRFVVHNDEKINKNDSADKTETNIKVEKEREDLISDLIIYPNPLTEKFDFLSIRFNLLEKAEVNIEICNILGQSLLKKDEGVKNKGINTIKINIDDFNKFTNGIYFVFIRFNGISYSKRFVISINSTEKLDFIGMDITYEGVIIARLSSIDHYWDDKKLIFVDKITYTIDKKYNYLYRNILKLCRERKPNYEVEIEIVK